MIGIPNLSVPSTNGAVRAPRYDGLDDACDPYIERDGLALAEELSNRIEDEISDAIARVETELDLQEPFEGRESYANFLEAQLVMQSILRPLYADPLLQRLFPALTETDQIALLKLDMADLGIHQCSNFGTGNSLPSGFVNRLGWLYIAEALECVVPRWSKMAIALDLDDSFGARHLAPRSDQVDRWEILIETLNQLDLSEVEEERVFAGARSALGIFSKMMRPVFTQRRARKARAKPI